MKNVFLTILVVLLSSSNAFAFISVIDVTNELTGETVTIQNASDYTLEQMEGKKLSYRGQVSEIVPLFTQIAEASMPGLIQVEVEINETTESAAFIVKAQGFGGSSYDYWVITKSGN